MGDKLDWMIIGSKVVFWGLSILVIYWLILKLTGHSPTQIQLLFATMGIQFTGLSGLTGLSFRLSSDFNRHLGKVEQHMKDTDRRLIRLSDDVREQRKEMHSYIQRSDERFASIDQKFTHLLLHLKENNKKSC